MACKGGFSCLLRGCSSRTGEGISFFSVPKDSERAKIWLQFCNREDLLEMDININYKVCEKHFEDKYISKTESRKCLFAKAVPTVHPTGQKPIEVVAEKTPELSQNITVLSGTSFLDDTSRSITSCRQESAVKTCSNTNDNLNMMLNRYPTSVIADISQASTSSILDNQFNTSKISESGQNNFGNNTEENVAANDDFDDKYNISYSSSSLSAPSSNNTGTCQSVNNNENYDGSVFHSIMNCKLEDDDFVVNEDTPPLWHFNYLPERQGLMEVDGDRPQQLRWFEMRCPSVT